jgi:hypothetical protein
MFLCPCQYDMDMQHGDMDMDMQHGLGHVPKTYRMDMGINMNTGMDIEIDANMDTNTDMDRTGT